MMLLCTLFRSRVTFHFFGGMWSSRWWPLLLIPTFSFMLVFLREKNEYRIVEYCTLRYSQKRFIKSQPKHRPTPNAQPPPPSIHHGRAQPRRYLQSYMRSNRHILPRHPRRSFPSRAEALQTGRSTQDHAYHSGRFPGHDRARNNATCVWRSCTCISAG